jgi:hypothetical protein
MVDRVFPGEQPEGTDIADGDLILAVELVRQDGTPVLVAIADVEALRDLWNDRELGDYERKPWKLWRARGTAVKAVEVTANRLFW